MFSFTSADNNSESEEELDFSGTKINSELGNIFARSQTHSSSSNSKLMYQAPKQPNNNNSNSNQINTKGEMRNVEIIQTGTGEERLEVRVVDGVIFVFLINKQIENGNFLRDKERNCNQLSFLKINQSKGVNKEMDSGFHVINFSQTIQIACADIGSSNENCHRI